jgi:hypothetical protein
MFVCFEYHRHIEGGKVCRASAPPTKAKLKKNTQMFSDTMSLKAERDLRFSLSEPLKSADKLTSYFATCNKNFNFLLSIVYVGSDILASLF